MVKMKNVFFILQKNQNGLLGQPIQTLSHCTGRLKWGLRLKEAEIVMFQTLATFTEFHTEHKGTNGKALSRCGRWRWPTMPAKSSAAWWEEVRVWGWGERRNA